MWRLVALFDLLSGEFISMIGNRFKKNTFLMIFFMKVYFLATDLQSKAIFLTILVYNEV